MVKPRWFNELKILNLTIVKRENQSLNLAFLNKIFQLFPGHFSYKFCVGHLIFHFFLDLNNINTIIKFFCYFY